VIVLHHALLPGTPHNIIAPCTLQCLCSSQHSAALRINPIQHLALQVRTALMKPCSLLLLLLLLLLPPPRTFLPPLAFSGL
jgi:hypothetical protein